jgi:carotenoid cleavage dioxygenase
MRLVSRLVLSAVIGRFRVPDPISARQPGSAASDRRFPYSWNPRYPARVGVMPRTGANADVRWFDVEPCYVFHPMNAYDEGDTVVLDVVRHPTMFDTNHLGPDEGPPTLDRWTVDLADGKVRESRVDDRGQEFPRVDERLVGRRHRYGYAPTVYGGESSDTLLKHDFVGGGTVARSFGAAKVLGEFVFEPSSPDAAEDDGVLMGYLYDKRTDRSELALLDAQTLQDVARIKLPHRVPAGFHGNWVPA